MEYTVKEVKGKNLKEGDKVWITGILGRKPWQPISNDEAKMYNTAYLYPDTTFLVRVPSSPVMNFEEFCKWQELEPDYNKVKTRSLYEGYLIGTRSIVPEMTDEEIGIISRQEYNKLYGEIGTPSEWKLFARDCEIGLKSYRNWLRSQINK